MVTSNKPAKRPPHICSRGPYRRKRDHIEDLNRLDVRDFIEQAVPFGDPDACLFQVQVTLKPGYCETLRLSRGNPLPNTPNCHRNHWWYWLCPDCNRKCRYIYTLPRSAFSRCRTCWNLPYHSQSKSHAECHREREEKLRPSMMSYTMGEFGAMYWYPSGRRVCTVPPKPPAGWIPPDLLKASLKEP